MLRMIPENQIRNMMKLSKYDSDAFTFYDAIFNLSFFAKCCTIWRLYFRRLRHFVIDSVIFY